MVPWKRSEVPWSQFEHLFGVSCSGVARVLQIQPEFTPPTDTYVSGCPDALAGRLHAICAGISLILQKGMVLLGKCSYHQPASLKPLVCQGVCSTWVGAQHSGEAASVQETQTVCEGLWPMRADVCGNQDMYMQVWRAGRIWICSCVPMCGDSHGVCMQIGFSADVQDDQGVCVQVCTFRCARQWDSVQVCGATRVCGCW